MEREEIRTAAQKMNSVKDLCRLLNRVKYEALGDKTHPFQLKQITYYCNPRRTGVCRYTNFSIPKKSGGVRTISAPVTGLKSILSSLNTILQSLYEPSKHAMGFVTGRSVVDNAKIHLGQNYIYNIDLEDFFPSVDKSRIWKRLTLPPFGFSSELADVIAGLCTMRLEVDGAEQVRYVLPQGAPTSPTITNIICAKLDRQLGHLAKKYGLRYSRYADDITFSSMHYIYAEDGDFVRELRDIIAQNRFAINEKKTRLQKIGERQEVTGLILSDKVNVARRYTREIRTILHIWERYGHLAACDSYMRHRKANPVARRKGGMPTLEMVVMGKLQYLKMVKGVDDALYSKLEAKFQSLVSTSSNKSKTSYMSHITYLHTLGLLEFENAFSTKLEYKPQDNSLVCYEESGNIRPITISKSVDVETLFGENGKDTDLWDKHQISLCDNGKTQFYMLHKKLVDPQHTTPVKNQTKELEGTLTELVNSELFSQVLGEKNNEIDVQDPEFCVTDLDLFDIDNLP